MSLFVSRRNCQSKWICGTLISKEAISGWRHVRRVARDNKDGIPTTFSSEWFGIQGSYLDHLLYKVVWDNTDGISATWLYRTVWDNKDDIPAVLTSKRPGSSRMTTRSLFYVCVLCKKRRIRSPHDRERGGRGSHRGYSTFLLYT